MYVCVCVFLCLYFSSSDSPVNKTYTQKRYYFTTKLLQAYYKAYYTIYPNDSHKFFENSKFSANFQIDNVPGIGR